MPRSARELIEFWRKRAEELRTTADGFRNSAVKNGFQEAARTYDIMADQAERKMAESNSSAASPLRGQQRPARKRPKPAR